MSKIALNQVYKRYDNSPQPSVADFNLKVEDQEFIVLVGPSGCGKSTTLRMIAGLEDITEGELFIDGVLMNDFAPKDRGMAMVFQNYALYPHLNVYDNIGFGLKIRGVEKSKRDKEIRETAELLGLTPYLDRKPKALSGGQRQRVALGRAIVKKSKIFLMDEPLSNLDAKLRVQMREELVHLHRNLGSTTIYVTHDQTEAMTMADRIVCMKDGIIQQVGMPEELYNNPKNLFVAGFLGSPPMNFLNGKIERGSFITEDGLKLADGINLKDQDIIVGIRPENIPLTVAGAGMAMNVELVELLGADYHIHGKLGNNKITLKVDVNHIPEGGIRRERLQIELPVADLLYFNPETDERIIPEV